MKTRNIPDFIVQIPLLCTVLVCLSLFVSCSGDKAPRETSATQQEADSLADVMYYLLLLLFCYIVILL